MLAAPTIYAAARSPHGTTSDRPIPQSSSPEKVVRHCEFSECRRRAFQKMHRKVVERWLYGALTDTAQLFSSASTIFPPLRVTDCQCVRPQGARRGTGVPPTCHWKVASRVEECDVLPDGSPWGILQSPNCKKSVPNSHPQVAVDY